MVIGSLAVTWSLAVSGHRLQPASKHALEGYAESLRIELRGTSVRVTIVEPGDFATGFTVARQVVAAAGEGSRYREALAVALDRISVMETVGGADPRLLSQCVASILDSDQPPLRAPVGAPSQVELIESRHQMSPDELEDMIAEAFGLDGTRN